MKTPPKDIVKLICHDVDLVGCITDHSRIPTIQHATNTQIEGTNTVYTPQNIVQSLHTDDRKKAIKQIRNFNEANTDTVELDGYRIKDATGNYRKYDLKIRAASEYPHIVHPMVTGVDRTIYYTNSQHEAIINRILRHDIRNKIGIIEGYAEVIEESEENPTQKKGKQINNAAKNIADLIEDIRYIKKRLDDVHSNLSQKNLKNIVEKAVAEYREKHPTITIHDQTPDVDIVGSHLIKDALSHLIENAIEHSDTPNEDLVITIEKGENKPQPMVSLTIKDNGKGINPPEYEPVLSDEETNLHHASGLGLWIVKWITDSVYGNFTIHRRKNTQGTIAKIEFMKHKSENGDNIQTLRKGANISERYRDNIGS